MRLEIRTNRLNTIGWVMMSKNAIVLFLYVYLRSDNYLKWLWVSCVYAGRRIAI